MPSVITFTGPSGSGKSTALQELLRCASKNFSPIKVAKYTTRPARVDDSGEAISVKRIPVKCDLVYEQYGVRYGVSLATLFHGLAQGKSPIIILNDVRTVEEVRMALGRAVKSVFVFRQGPSLERYTRLSEARNIRNDDDLQKRFNKAQAIYRIYIENIHLFDHVIINGGTRKHLSVQVRQIVKGLQDEAHWPLRGKL